MHTKPLYRYLEHCWGSGSHADDIYINEHSLVLLFLGKANKPPSPHISSFSPSFSFIASFGRKQSEQSISDVP